MKTLLSRLVPVLLAAGTLASAQTVTYTNFIRQVQMPSGVQWDATVAATGTQLSALAIDPGGARFELWTVKSTPLTSYLLDTRYVGTYVPQATVNIRTEDPYPTITRTRADRPFYVDVTIVGLLAGVTDPEPSKSVKFLRHVQSYGAGGTGIGIDRAQATLLTQSSIAANGTQTLTYALNSVPGAVRTKVRGEERFSVFSLADYQAPESQLASKYLQIWPVADGSIAGLAEGQLIRFAAPQLTLTLNDLYPSSTTYAQVYQGNPQLGVTGTTVPGSALVISESVPQNRVLLVKDYDSVFSDDGRWTMELLTVTPFGIDRLAYVSFDIERIIKMIGNLTTSEE
ncbi:MAG: hypothetical protein NTW21_34350 [Verrucomicrobia bacterium]|nr:hypothetical protein [Verrucomicrobiota bacterium]